jgi:hypothetical protein
MEDEFEDTGLENNLLVNWYSTQLTYPISKDIRKSFQNKMYFELIYSEKHDAFKFKSTNYPNIDQTILIRLEVEIGNDEPTGFIKYKLSEYYSNKRISDKYFKLDIQDITDIRELIWSIEGEDINDHVDEYIENIFNVN